MIELASRHLLLRLLPLNRALRRAAERQGRAAARLARPDIAPLCVTEDQVGTLLDDVDALLEKSGTERSFAKLDPEEEEAQEDLRRRARDTGRELPFDRLERALGLHPVEMEAVLLTAAVEIDRSYERVYAYVLDDLNRRFPCVELVVSLTAGSVVDRLERRRLFGRFGRLRRTGVLAARGDSPNELRQELRLGAGVLDFLASGEGDPAALFRDPAEVTVQSDAELPPGVDRARVERLSAALDRGTINIVGIWGPARDDVALALARLSGRPLRRLRPSSGGEKEEAPVDVRIRESLAAAAVLGALVWVATDDLDQPNTKAFSDLLTEALETSAVPVLLTGSTPWRPLELLTARAYGEIEIEPPDIDARESTWSRILSELDSAKIGDLASRYRIGQREIRAVARLARTRAQLESNGRPAALEDQLEGACAAVTRRRSYRFASLVQPRRGPDDLVLPPELHSQVLEIGRFFRSWPRVAEKWGFGRLVTGGGGIRALFTGDSGTGKTLAAEVIAHLLQVPLLRVDLARVVSKWVGETEKNLESVFREAEESHTVLFFDEADALFGKRSEVRHGTDRYANLEVSYLLQRLEEYGGLVILASNLRDHIDPAFIRRFQVALHFPRPGVDERLRIWQRAFPQAAPLGPDVELGCLARLDMTGGSISNAAKTAALLAAGANGHHAVGENGSHVIGMSHVVRGVSRQYRREARLLAPAELGGYASLLEGLA